MSFTGIGRIGSQHTLTSIDADALYLFNSVMWCTHPLLALDFVGASMAITVGSKIVTGDGSTFTLLCPTIEATGNNVPLNKYIAYSNVGNGSYGVLEVDYVLDDSTMILKYPAFETIGNIAPDKASLIDYWGTPILKEVEVRNPNTGTAPVVAAIANKYSSNDIAVYDIPFTANNEGGVEPQLISNGFIVTLKY